MEQHNYRYEHSHYDNSLPVYLWELSSQQCENLIYYNLHRELEFIQVIKGELCLYIDEKQIHLAEGEIGIINTGRMHHGYAANDAVCEVRVYIFDVLQLISQNLLSNGRLLTALTQEELWLPSQVTTETAIYSQLTKLLEQMAVYWHTSPAAYELKLKSLLFDLLFLFLGHESLLTREREWGTTKSREKREKLLTLVDFLETHCQEELSLPLMADVLCMGKDSFYKFMISMTGAAPMTFLRQFRLEKSARLLASTNLSVTEVCFQTGFSNVSYFIKCFRERYGCTPRQYR
ncbi:MAG: AraC family transcriptional regulator [Lachnospiraceae bacterium]|nr:AraC family transcriptional regulator [Lachnospiraceae bacterium]